MLVCVVVIVVARYGRRWLGGRGGDDGVIRVRGRLPLEPRRALYVVEVGGRTLLVGSSEGGIQLLSEIEAEALPEEPAPRGGFAALVAHALARRGSGRRGPATEAGAGASEEPTA
ncbi:MAG TPA: flagellar biosynthetic protein FliO [Kofleriaceae bacterium]|nr:flagellar biosynthetic protein FliO [Kofleriaceae bacterium]